ncbi:MAG: translocation/assembly module TamB domain-containing protein [Xenococcaceae cyanobacterium MO_167.B52]|nr:translocation/assembly module TamB domain-containing protein [Xenococcaceae cyanobacterium MO_167.B52]
MTKLINNSTDPDPEPPEPQKHWLVKLLQPSKKKILGLSAIAGISVIAYGGLDFWVRQNLPSIIESQGSKILNRPIEVGKVKRFSLTGVTLDSSYLPATETDRDHVSIDEIRVGYNIFPVIFRQVLVLDITLLNPKVYLEQKADGLWLNLDLPQGKDGLESFLSYDIKANIVGGDIQVVPYQKSLIKIALDGEGRYNSNNKGQIEYDLAAKIEKAKATIEGKTFLATGATETKLLINNLALTDIVSLVPNSPVNLSQGVVNANLDVNIPSWAEFTAANIEGTLKIGDVRGEIADRDIKANSWLRFGGKDVKVKSLEATVEDIQAQVTGAIDLQQGYDLDIVILPLDLATLPKTFATELPVPITGGVEGKIQLRGDIKQPQITGSIQNTKSVTIDKQSFKTIAADFKGDLDKFTLERLQIVPTVGGLITATGEIGTNIKHGQEIDLTKMPVSFNFQANLPTVEIVKPYYQFPGNITVGNLISKGTITGTIKEPQILLQWRIAEANTLGETINGQGKIVLAKNNILLEDTLLKIGKGRIDVEGKSNLVDKTWETIITANGIELNSFLSQLPLAGIDLNRPIAVNNATTTLSGTLEESAIDKIQGTANINLELDNNSVTIDSSLNQGEIIAQANTETIVLDRYISNLPTPITIQSSRIDFVSKIAPLLKEKPDLSKVKTRINTNLLLAEGTVKTQVSLENNQWQANIQGNSLSPSLLSPQLPANLKPVDTNIQISGDIQPLITQEKNLPIKADQITIITGQQYLKAEGNIILSDLQNKPDIASAALAINTRLNFNDISLPDLIPNNQQSLATIPNILGQAEFRGNLQGKNLISNPSQPGNLFLIGDITLKNLAVNNTIFEPVMTGKVNINPEEKMTLAIQGKEDIISLSAEPCVSDRCRFSYVPTSLTFRVKNQNNSIIATGNRRGDLFNVNIANFPLTILNVTPVKPWGLDSPVKGTLTGDVEINLFSLGTKGNIAIERLGVGYIEAKKLAANFDYNVERNFAEVKNASLLVKNSEYNFNGSIDLNSGNLQGKLNIPQAYIQDILTTLYWYTLADVINVFDNPSPVSSQAIQTQNITTVGKSIRLKLEKLRQIEQQLQATAKKNHTSGFLTQLDIRGGYRGEVLIAGNINNPEIDFNIEAQDWIWNPQNTAINVIPAEGVVKQNFQVINIPQIRLEGEVQNNVLNLDIAKLQVEDATLLVKGILSPNQQNATFDLDNFTTDIISKFVTIPVDVTGKISTEGTVTGTLSQPKVQGNIVFADTTFNQQNLLEKITGNYIYQNQKLNFNTTNPESIEIAATVPYPIQPQINDQLTAEVKLNTEAFNLLGALTQNNLTWVGGEANADISATANIDLNRDAPLYNVRAIGEVNLDQAQLKTNIIQETISATGKVTLDNQLINVETLKGNLGSKDLSATGTVPLLYAVNNLENPLTINIPPGAIELKELYRGEIAGNIILTGAAIKPVIGGEVALKDGRFFLPKSKNGNTISKVIKDNSNQNSNTSFPIFAQDFLVKLDQFTLQEEPLYNFAVSGNLNLNGTLNNISQLKGEGTLKLVRAYVNWVSNSFSLTRSRDNVIVFTPEADITNPYLNIQLRSSVEEVNNKSSLFSTSSKILESGRNEIPDDITSVQKTRAIDIRLNIDGKVEEILPVIPDDKLDNCNIRPNNLPPTGNYTYSTTELEKLTNCINLTAFNSRSDRDQDETLQNPALLDSPAISLSSTPERSETEIMSLLGNQFLSFTEKVSHSNSAELLQLGINQFVINPLARQYLYRLNDFVLNQGQNLGLEYLRVFPYIEAIYSLNGNLFLRSIYDPKLFSPNSDNTAANNTKEVFEIRLEYRLKF